MVANRALLAIASFNDINIYLSSITVMYDRCYVSRCNAIWLWIHLLLVFCIQGRAFFSPQPHANYALRIPLSGNKHASIAISSNCSPSSSLKNRWGLRIKSRCISRVALHVPNDIQGLLQHRFNIRISIITKNVWRTSSWISIRKMFFKRFLIILWEGVTVSQWQPLELHRCRW